MESTWDVVERLRAGGALVQCITNFVSMDLMANVLLAVGASPAMAHSLEEVEDFIGIASALNINMGTLDPDWLAAMKLCTHQAVKLHKPWVLDPVGCGATPYRTNAIMSLLACKPTVVRGNAGEILALSGVAGGVRGVDSLASVRDAEKAAADLALEHRCVVAVSGAVDFVTDGTKWARVKNGTPMLTKITAAGCSVTALIAACCAILPDDPLSAAAHGLAMFGLAAELGENHASCRGPGSLRVALLDELASLQKHVVNEGVKIERGVF